ncbi:MAG: LptF/LptG family permease [Acidobacteria bacterium]|nr:LptF/LptG family permease [Acidobacteriota bacterium]
MSLLARYIFREIVSSALLGTLLFTFVLFLRNVGQLFELLVRHTASGDIVLYLFALTLPQTLTFTIPMGVLVGILIGLGRMSGDGEVIAVRAAGIPTRRFIWPVAAFALLGLAASATVSLYLSPRALREFYRIQNRLRSSQLSAEIQPRVFEEGFPNTILYVRDVIPGPVVRWRGVFLADLRSPQQRSSSVNANVRGPRITVAEEAIAVPNPEKNQIQLHLIRGGTHEQSTDPAQYFNYAFDQTDQILDAAPPSVARARRPYQEMNSGELPYYAHYAENWLEARIELYQRLALPAACLVLALVGIPLGLSSRRSGKSTGVVLTVLLVFVYFTLLIGGIGLAERQKLAAGPAVWGANAFFALFGVLLLSRLDSPGDRDWLAALGNWAVGLRIWSRGWLATLRAGRPANGRGSRSRLLFQLLDSYVLSSFLFYFFVLLASFVLLYHVFTFFELLSYILTNHVALSRFLTYLFYLTPQLIYTTAPISVLVATLVAFGVLTKRNEITAFKACGISLYRLTVPVLLVALAASGSLFVFDHYVLPESNRRQDAIRNEIKGRPVATYLRPDRQWIFGRGNRIYYYNYFDPVHEVLGGVNVFEFDSTRFRLARHISAERAHWEDSLRAWVFEDGWSRDIHDIQVRKYDRFTVQTFAELEEQPGYFLTEAKQYQQMNFHELQEYILDLTQRGFDTVRLRVQLHKKFSFPAFAFIMGLLAVPFAFLTGNRGALAGVAVSLGIAIVYVSVNALFEQMGNVHQLPAMLAAWSPDVIFTLAGTYLLLRLRT